VKLTKRQFRFPNEDEALRFWSEAFKLSIGEREAGCFIFNSTQDGNTVEIETFTSIIPTIETLAAIRGGVIKLSRKKTGGAV
jgi:hypothetical protein